eukprot:CAMPEP_0177224164 /NCGR_PEP_ID=MMETSP0367-20130122/38877_1 /TAXON_ID=447022 ORGANISM="Scrippsiella hangoei-like, Strain SHHI-4" /NCGR_SAMPLE_ID=MMETSP0367 /ASSEMBLY_ACC=CAM_ASM_000362 /LENGTH=58 /DNA_ID=CAMNT_0018674193 /DNA_START=10 /DNA_END=186 /DNA_ORIENTATION=+
MTSSLAFFFYTCGSSRPALATRRSPLAPMPEALILQVLSRNLFFSLANSEVAGFLGDP